MDRELEDRAFREHMIAFTSRWDAALSERCPNNERRINCLEMQIKAQGDKLVEIDGKQKWWAGVSAVLGAAGVAVMQKVITAAWTVAK